MALRGRPRESRSEEQHDTPAPTKTFSVRVTQATKPTAVLIPDPSMVDKVRLGDILVRSGVVTRDDVERAATYNNDRRLGDALIDDGAISEIDVTRALSEQLHAPMVDLRTAEPNEDAIALVASADAHRYDVLPLMIVGDGLGVAVADPFNEELTAYLRALPIDEVRLALVPRSQLQSRINQTYPALSALQSDIDAFRASDIVAGATDSADAVVDPNAPIVQVVNKIVTQALRDRASDVHVEPAEDCVRIRFRIDGALTDVTELPALMAPAFVSRVKIMAEMNIVERRRPQDGQFEMNIDGRDLDVRVSTTTTIWGEKMVMRLLDRTRSLFKLGELGMPEDSASLYSRIVSAPFGMVIVGGPTGSGKTTTLYATLSEINRRDINVMTIEDPVEYIFPRVNQIQISDQAGMTFATGLKSILRQDPDVILVGEVRDVETARIAVQSALTGHRVFSSIHAIDAVSSLYRLLDMGIEPFLVTSAIIGVVAQRLVRRTCASCAIAFEPSASEKAIYEKLGGREKQAWLRGEGCQLCAGTGYYDRVGVYEVLAITDEMRQCVVDGQPPRVARELAIDQGLRTLQSEAIRLVEQDVTTMDEIVKHVLFSEADA
jgi:type IV pilus assembly protein PilB